MLSSWGDEGEVRLLENKAAARVAVAKDAVSRVPPTILETDVLVIGGGFAGCFAAVKAVEASAKVVMAV
jgi:heterodisulfide reductase subunit A-like polyferredoxin